MKLPAANVSPRPTGGRTPTPPESGSSTTASGPIGFTVVGAISDRQPVAVGVTPVAGRRRQERGGAPPVGRTELHDPCPARAVGQVGPGGVEDGRVVEGGAAGGERTGHRGRLGDPDRL